MSLHRHVTVTFTARCDVRVDAAGAVVKPTEEEWQAYWESMDGPGPTPEIRAAVGQGCPGYSNSVRAQTAGGGRKVLANAGWTFASRRGEYSGKHMGWRAACPDHKGAL